MKRTVLLIAALLCVFWLSACGSAQKSEVSAQGDVSSAMSKQETTEGAKVSEDSEAANAISSTDASDSKTESKSDIKTEKIDSEDSETVVSESSSIASVSEETASDNTVVVYFSATGTTRGVAERIASVTNADLYEIVPAEPYSDADLDWNDKDSRTTLEMNDPDIRPAIADDTIDLSGYTTVYIGYPIWWGDAPRIMSTFVESHSFDGMTVIPFCTSGGSSIGRSGDNLASQAGSGNWLPGDRLDGGISEEEIENWISGS